MRVERIAAALVLAVIFSLGVASVIVGSTPLAIVSAALWLAETRR